MKDHPPFSTAAGLRDALLGSYPDAAYFGGPYVGVNRDDTEFAWVWVVEFIGMRSDWWPALGIALQHAVRDGGDLARTAVVDLMGDYNESAALVPWAEPIAREWPDLGTTGTKTGFGQPDYRLESIVRAQMKYSATFAPGTGGYVASLTAFGKGGKDIDAPLASEADLRAVLDLTARAGRFPGGDQGPWSWLGWELLFGGAWLWPVLVEVFGTIESDDTHQVGALLDWFSEERDLWRFVPLLERWHADPPVWWTTPAETRPKGWKYDMRSAHWSGVSTLGGVASEALRRARGQAATPPILDLPLLFGPAAARRGS